MYIVIIEKKSLRLQFSKMFKDVILWSVSLPLIEKNFHRKSKTFKHLRDSTIDNNILTIPRKKDTNGVKWNFVNSKLKLLHCIVSASLNTFS